MTTLPYTNIINFQVRFLDEFATRRGFGTTVFMQSKSIPDKLDGENRTRYYTSIDEVAVDFDAADEAYKAANTAFSQKPRPIGFKVGYYDATEINAAKITDELDALYEADDGWFFLTFEASVRDDSDIAEAIAKWAEARPITGYLESNDERTEDPADTESVSAVLKQTEYEQTGVFYSQHEDEYPAVALCAVVGAFNFDDEDSAYTPAFKTLRGITPSKIRSTQFRAITGFVPGLGHDKKQGHLATVYTNVGGQNIVLFGSMLKPNKFLDEVHFEYWLKARGEEEQLNILKNNQKVDYDDPGLGLLASGIETVLDRAVNAGHIAKDVVGDDGQFEAPYRLEIPRALSVPASQRNARISPQIKASFRHSGAIHYVNALVDVTV